MFCTKCGSIVPEAAAFCRECGQPVSGQPIPPEGAVPLVATDVFASPPAAAAQAVGTLPLIAVPNAVILPAPYAGFWLRFVAYVIDSAIVAVAFGVVVAIAIASVGLRFFRGFAPGLYDRPVNPFFPVATLGVILVLLPITILITWLYFALMESSQHQGTLGKMALGLLVTDLQGQRISFARASGRFFAKFITGLIPLFIGYLMAGFTEKRQALHDMIAGCLVLKRV
jgi:uncharacterized RDD family membrane protein YckC